MPEGFALNDPVDCFTSGISAYAGSALFIDQSGAESLAFPEGTALPFASGEILMLQLHTINTSASPIDTQLDVTLEMTDATEVKKLGLIQFYNPFIYVPPMGSSSAHLRCSIPEEITLLNATTHFHLRGTNEEVFVQLPGQDELPLVQSSDWEHPNQWTGPMTLPAGSSVRFQCDYQNPDPRPYVQGQEKGDNEMCMVIGFYHPVLDDAFEGCFTGTDVGTGTKTCAETQACTQACPPGDAPRPNGTLAIDVGACFQQCVVEACPSASNMFQQLGGCVQQNCAADCATGGPECGACVSTRCGAELGGCMANTCS
jgi:hypothetical protein